MSLIVIHILIRAFMFLVFLGAMGDVVSTIIAIRAGAIEANPVTGWIMRICGPKWVIARLLFGLLNIWIVMHNPAARESWTGLASFTFNIVLMSFVIWHNLGVAKKLKAQRRFE